MGADGITSDGAGSRLIPVRIDDVDIEVALDLINGIWGGFEALWLGDRLRPLRGSIEGRDAVEFFDRVITLWRARIAEAAREQRPTITFETEIPDRIADTVIVFTRNVLQLLAQGSTGAEPLPADRAALADGYLDQVETAIARFRATYPV